MMSEALVHGDVHLLLFNMLYREHEEVGGNMPVDGEEDGGCKCVCVKDITLYLHVCTQIMSCVYFDFDILCVLCCKRTMSRQPPVFIRRL